MGNAVEIKAVDVSYHNEIGVEKKDTRHSFVTKNLRLYAMLEILIFAIIFWDQREGKNTRLISQGLDKNSCGEVDRSISKSCCKNVAIMIGNTAKT